MSETSQQSPAQDTPRFARRMIGLIAFGAWFGSVCGIVLGTIVSIAAGIDLIAAEIRAMAGGLLGGAAAMFIVSILGGRKCSRLHQTQVVVFGSACGTMLGGFAGVGVLHFLKSFAGREMGVAFRLSEDLQIIMFIAGGLGSVSTWAISHIAFHTRRRGFILIVMFIGAVACLVLAPFALPLCVAGIVAGILSRQMLWARIA